MQLIRFNLLYFLMAMVVLSVTSCKDEPVSSTTIPSDACYDFVTIVESSENGSVFEMRKKDDSPIITYTSSFDLASSSTHVTVGDRVIICYERIGGRVYTSGAIRLFGYVKMGNTDLNVQMGTAEKYDNWASQPFYMKSIWRTGPYINMQSQLYSLRSFPPKTFIIVADAATIDDEMPVLHLVYENADDNDGENRFSNDASFDISEVWNRSTCRGVVIKYPTINSTESVAFLKSTI